MIKRVKQEALKAAIELFSASRTSTSEAAAIAGLSVGEVMDELTKKGISQNITVEDIKGSFGRALKVVK